MVFKTISLGRSDSPPARVCPNPARVRTCAHFEGLGRANPPQKPRVLDYAPRSSRLFRRIRGFTNSAAMDSSRRSIGS